MTESPLLSIENNFVRVEVYGPFASPRNAEVLDINPSAVGAHFEVEPNIHPTIARYRDAVGLMRQWTNGEHGPRFHEGTRYRMVAVASVGAAPRIIHRDSALTQDANTISGQPITILSLDFHEQIGLSAFEIRTDVGVVRFTIEVFPTKLDYATDYRELLYEVGAAARGLAFEYLRSTYVRAGAKAAEATVEIEWLTLLRKHIDGLEAAVAFIGQHPRRSLVRTVEPMRIERIRRSSSSLRTSVARGSGNGEWIVLPRVGKVHSRILGTRASETLDTPEHRWLKRNLMMTRDQLSRIAQQLDREVGGSWSGRESSRLRSERAEVYSFRDRIERLLETPLLRSIPGLTLSEFTSLTLMMAPGYSEAYQHLLALRLGLNVDGGALELSTKELDVLYETWCFIRIARMLVELAPGKVTLDDLIAISATGIRVRLRRDHQSNIGLQANGRELVLSYNRHFDGLTGAQRPDIVLELRHMGWPEIIVVFDAKYRVDTSATYLRAFTVPGPPIDAVNALHRYRDAIVLGAKDSPRGRPVVKGVALFPLAASLVVQFEQHQPLFQALAVLGIGALPFLPDCTASVERWLRALLESGPETLASPGPEWLAFTHLRSL